MASYLDFFLVVCSPFIGSFLGLLTYRLPIGQTVIFDRSRCDHCGKTLGALNLMPIVSFLAQRGKSICCGKAIPTEYLWIEILATMIAIVCVVLFSMPHAALGVLLGWCLLTLSFIDAVYFRCSRFNLPINRMSCFSDVSRVAPDVSSCASARL